METSKKHFPVLLIHISDICPFHTFDLWVDMLLLMWGHSNRFNHDLMHISEAMFCSNIQSFEPHKHSLQSLSWKLVSDLSLISYVFFQALALWYVFKKRLQQLQVLWPTSAAVTFTFIFCSISDVICYKLGENEFDGLLLFWRKYFCCKAAPLLLPALWAFRDFLRIPKQHSFSGFS